MEVLITAGLGDFITIESYLSDKFLSKIKKIYLATPRSEIVKNILNFYPTLKNVEVEILPYDLRITPQIKNKEHLKLVYQASNASLNVNLDNIVDLSISVFFEPKILPNFKGSSLLKNNISLISHKLPEKYIVICPSSTMRDVRQDIEISEWQNILFYLIQTDQQAIILGLNDAQCPVPNNSRFINLLGKTTFAESVEILKLASGYIGVDSALSVLAAQIFDSSQLLIKSCNPILGFYKKYYYHPHSDFDFIASSVYPCRNPPLFAKYPALQYCSNSQANFNLTLINELAYFFTRDIVFQMDFMKCKTKDFVGSTDNKDVKAKFALVKKYIQKGKLLDIGFTDVSLLDKIKKMAYGFSINPAAINWLLNKKLYYNPYNSDLSEFSVVTFWDSLQNIINPSLILSKVIKDQLIIVSTPIIEDLSQLNTSDHLKINENLYYWTRESFLWFMNSHGFDFIEEQIFKGSNLNTFVLKKARDIKVSGFGQMIEY